MPKIVEVAKLLGLHDSPGHAKHHPETRHLILRSPPEAGVSKDVPQGNR
jgi:hypothetical protein